MKQYPSYINEYPVYPGEYSPMPEKEALLKELRITDTSSKPLVNMNESKDCYVVKAVIPGAKREDIFIDIDKNILSIIALQKDSSSRKHWEIHEYETNNFERHIVLPQDADSIFVNAEYRQGILRIYIPKSENPVRNLSGRVVVY